MNLLLSVYQIHIFNQKGYPALLSTDYLHFINLAETILLLLADIQDTRKLFVYLNTWHHQNKIILSKDAHFPKDFLRIFTMFYKIFTVLVLSFSETPTMNACL